MSNTLAKWPEEEAMNFLKRIEGRDWLIAVVAFIGGAWLF
jgi:hypothetical protein